MSLPFNNFSVFPSCRTPIPTNYPKNLHPHEQCLGCSSPCHSSGDCLHWGQFSNFSYGQLNTNFLARGLNHVLILTPLTGITTLMFRGMLMPRETMLSNPMNCAILNTHNSIPPLSCLHCIIILLKSHQYNIFQLLILMTQRRG